MKTKVLYTRRVTILILQILFGLVCLLPFLMAYLAYTNPQVYVEIGDVIPSFFIYLGVAAVINVPLFLNINRLFHIKLELNPEKIKYYHPKYDTVGIAWNEINHFYVDYVKSLWNIELYEIADGMKSIRFYRFAKKPKNIEQNPIGLFSLNSYSICLSKRDCDELIRIIYLYAQMEATRKSGLVNEKKSLLQAS